MLLAEPLRQLDLLRFTRLISTHQHQSKVIERQLVAVFRRPSPGLVKPVSDERIAPNHCTRIANARFYIGYAPAKKRVIVATIAHPQSRNFKRWGAELTTKITDERRTDG